MFYDKKCSIYQREIVTENFREVAKDTLLYEDLECDFFDEKYGLQLGQGNIAQEEENWKLTVVLEGFYPGIKNWAKIELKDPDLGSIGIFQLLRAPEVYRLPNGVVESMTLFVRKHSNELWR